MHEEEQLSDDDCVPVFHRLYEVQYALQVIERLMDSINKLKEECKTEAKRGLKALVTFLKEMGITVTLPRDDSALAIKMWIAQNNLNRSKKSLKWIEKKCPRQPNNTDCGYYVLRYILDKMRKEQDCNHGEISQGRNCYQKTK
ncbi:hypothetical protein V2J09_008962 [Rumex salicifolius]